MSLRTNFPPKEEQYQGGMSDGKKYELVFAGSSFAKSFEMILQFLSEEGYADIPVPGSFQELKLFRLKAMKNQLKLFDEIGYLHNPIKILFPESKKYPRSALVLQVFDEQDPQNLLRFHGLL